MTCFSQQYRLMMRKRRFWLHIISARPIKDWNGGAGNNVKIDHGNGYVSQYMHLSKILVKKGQHVDKGQLIGIMGCSGSCTGTHLHFTVYRNGQLMDPLKLYQ